MSKLTPQKQRELILSTLGDAAIKEEEIIEEAGDPYLTPGSRVIMIRGDKKCMLCGKVDETRPYGPHGEEICFECGMKNEELTIRQMNRVLFGET
jgi:hypothetical protein